MLPPEDLSRLRDMLDYSRRVEQHVAGATRADFDADEQLQTTVKRNHRNATPDRP
jgi:uncharacterized protein with HEPN domain